MADVFKYHDVVVRRGKIEMGMTERRSWLLLRHESMMEQRLEPTFWEKNITPCFETMKKIPNTRYREAGKLKTCAEMIVMISPEFKLAFGADRQEKIRM